MEKEIKTKYDVPIEVSKEKFDLLQKHCTGICAFREHEGKYYIKVWNIKYKYDVLEILNS